MTKSILKGVSSGELKKLKITAFSDPQFKTPITENSEFVTLVNPEKYSKNYKVDYIVPDASNTNGHKVPYYAYTPPSDLDLEFLFDDTGVFDDEHKFSVSEARESNGVDEAIKKFVDMAYAVNGNIHRPNYLKINWGTLEFRCVLAELNIEYKLFSPDAKPLRAVAKAKFKNFASPEETENAVKPSSPDLTHIRIVEEGDTLPLMTKRIYGDSKYYLEVARVNKLTTFRKLKAGQRLFFPPIQKPD
ncbi:LysM peptidoglycan-binding domain-containing protein [Fluviicola sp.]|uniref:CIS tube protein n=1 Tax=Fluviicola sp. TaxID=1917219 RepID=UPI0031E0CB75